MTASSRQFRKIHDIISSELVVRQNNVNFIQEFAVLSSATTSTVFTTNREIHEIAFVTVNGITVHNYTVSRPNTITISGIASSPANDVLIGYFYNNGTVANTDSCTPGGSPTLPPNIELFTTTPSSGQDGDIVLDFRILANGGSGISWNIYKTGANIPLFSGTALESNNGYPIGGYSATPTPEQYKYVLTQAEYLAGVGRDLSFTLIVDYAFNGIAASDATSTSYSMLQGNAKGFEGAIEAVPPLLDTPGKFTVSLAFNVKNLEGGTFEWGIYKTRVITGDDPGVGSVTSLIHTGTSTIPLVTTVTDAVSVATNQQYDYVYELKARGTSRDYTFVDSTRIAIDTIAVAGGITGDIIAYPANIVTQGNVNTELELIFTIASGTPQAEFQVERYTRNHKTGTYAAAPTVVYTGDILPSTHYTKTLSESFVAGDTRVYDYVLSYRDKALGGAYIQLSAAVVDVAVPATVGGRLTVTPSSITKTGLSQQSLGISLNDLGSTYEWKVSRIKSTLFGTNAAHEPTVVSGSYDGNLVTTAADSLQISTGETGKYTYILRIKPAGTTSYVDVESVDVVLNIGGGGKVTAGISTTTSLIDTKGTTPVPLRVVVDNPNNTLINWRIFKTVNKVETEIESGGANTAIDLIRTDNIVAFDNDVYTIRYLLQVNIGLGFEDYSFIDVVVSIIPTGVVVGFLQLTPTSISTAGTTSVDVRMVTTDLTGALYDWNIVKIDGAIETLVAAGTGENADKDETFQNIVNTGSPENRVITYGLLIKELGTGLAQGFRVEHIETLDINVI